MNIAGRIDHTLLKPEATEKDIVDLCHEAVKHGFASVCVNPVYICTAARLLHGTSVIPCTVIGFPLGAAFIEIKMQEILAAKAHGAREVDAVMCIGKAKSGDWKAVQRDVNLMVQTAQGCGLKIKIIIETGLLNEDEKQKAAEIVREAGADYIKTSTGYFGGATVEDVKNLKNWAGPGVKVKASGGIKTKEFALELIKAGADRLGTSSGIVIIQ
ncbi:MULTISPECIES: deoxyribose-phosphate aldolase [Dehalobacter]|jgi:deoxyribose-phosphate aldolase|uniref:Deoxyribose-phosphate aldolase n=2 Tax=Dehalobacter restrictus TaxID=55583 RepID=A0A857DHH7_9FIRM|nr:MULTISPECIES: deoxyribose-phosphate aldolase [Dehalobacter]AHF09218.1 deoxyribose-phosphate aldolase [Dehalobacter restrictus DSM 9455]MCG1025779.1 deoxyribose-phosphate aldolase [Dehalobacter sp.]MDJ0306404.1 deoxyribose-phosphate aldolase [Dehalobacter sp.]OCZ51421.1 deoxyribose-phosphate aldolase [Dehalobacter sp. TeCB1]QGZ99754.1 deoxyribose-phosphate aldolase [Dehalobacter restrictus]